MADNLTTQTVLNSGSLNPLQPSGPVQACNGVALPLHIYTFNSYLSQCTLRVHYGDQQTEAAYRHNRNRRTR